MGDTLPLFRFMIPDAIREPLDPTLARLSALAARLRSVRPLAPEFEASLVHRLRIELTHGSTAIEGNTLTLRETQLLIDEGLAPGGAKALREIHETLNHHRAVLALQDWVNEGRPVSEDGLRELHRLVLQNIDDERSGRYRSARVMVAAAPRQPIHPDHIATAMAELVDWVNGPAGHPVLIAAAAHYRFVKIHPFFDGNGRTGRLLLNWVLLRSGYPLTVIQASDRSRYLHALDEADRDQPLDYYRFLSECVERSLSLYLSDDTGSDRRPNPV